MSLYDRLGRLLFIVPYVTQRDGASLDELASLLGVSCQQIRADVELLAMVGQPPLTPDHLIDVYIEEEIVYVELNQSLSRPLRLTHEEARALVIGAKLVGHLGGLGQELEGVLARLMAHLSPGERQAVEVLSAGMAVQEASAVSGDGATLLRAAIEAHREVDAVYYSASNDRQKHYCLKPLALLTHGGLDYVVALDSDAQDQEKLFRLDRLGSVCQREDVFSPPKGFNIEKFRTPRLYFGTDPMHAEIRLAPALARRVRQRFSDRDITTASDGSIRVQLTTSSVPWLARWVLALGPEAEVLTPGVCRAYMHELCATAAAVYQDAEAFPQIGQGQGE